MNLQMLIGAAIVLLALFAVGLIAGLFPATHDDQWRLAAAQRQPDLGRGRGLRSARTKAT